jgi:Flp pilus assembly protein TadD
MSRTLHLIVALLGAGSLIAACDSGAEDVNGKSATTSLHYVGAASCTTCHATESKAWQGSHHDLAMQEANANTVLGDFSAPDFVKGPETTSFAQRGGRYYVTTPGPDGERTEYEVAYTFGYEPLQQYLVAFPGGRYQALSVAWDSRPAEAGGQRWFHLYPDEEVLAGDPLHWTSPLANWNQQCADCHSTQLSKNYDRESRSYATAWEVLDVSCEACHGPASQHVATAEAGEQFNANFGFERRLSGAGGWILDAGTTARRMGGPDPTVQLDSCAPCHSRRGELVENRGSGETFEDAFRPALLEERLYHDDGQIDDEVYVWGSFLQSKMHAAGVVCSDCHDPHSLKLEFSGNDLCTRCHDRKHYDAPEHHHHAMGTAGASCVECHMPSTTYMVVDPRRDHSLRVPRPDLSVELGTPNACNDCHDDRDAAWAAAAVDEWTGGKRPPHRGQAFRALRSSRPTGESALLEIANDALQPGIVRATALADLAQRGSTRGTDSVARAAQDESGLVLYAALQGAGSLHARGMLEDAQLIELAAPQLQHELRLVRLEAARALMPLHHQLQPTDREAYDAAHAERLASLEHNADDPRALVDLGLLHQTLGDFEAAEATYCESIEIGPWYAEAYANLADMLRAMDRDADGAQVLREGLQHAVDTGPLEFALGLNLVRQERLLEAISHLRRATELSPDEARFAHVHAVALHSFGRTEAAANALEAALLVHPADLELLNTQISILLELGRKDDARELVKRLLEIDPTNEDARAYLESGR